MHQFIPHALLPDRKTLPWITKALVNATKMQNYYFRKSKQTGDEAAFLKYKQLSLTSLCPLYRLSLLPQYVPTKFFASLSYANAVRTPRMQFVLHVFHDVRILVPDH